MKGVGGLGDLGPGYFRAVTWDGHANRILAVAEDLEAHRTMLLAIDPRDGVASLLRFIDGAAEELAVDPRTGALFYWGVSAGRRALFIVWPDRPSLLAGAVFTPDLACKNLVWADEIDGDRSTAGLLTTCENGIIYRIAVDPINENASFRKSAQRSSPYQKLFYDADAKRLVVLRETDGGIEFDKLNPDDGSWSNSDMSFTHEVFENEERLLIALVPRHLSRPQCPCDPQPLDAPRPREQK